MLWLKHKRTLVNRVMLIVAMAVMFNILLCFLLLMWTDTFGMLRTEAYEDFANTVNGDAENLSLALCKDAVNGMVLASGIDQRIERLASRNNSTTNKLVANGRQRELLLEIGLGALKSGLEANEFTGAFILLYDSDAGRDEWSGAYLRRTDAGEYTLERGPKSLAAEYDLRLGDDWNEALVLPRGAECSAFLRVLSERKFEPGSAFRENGYWTSPVDLFGVGDKGVFFTVPLLSGDGGGIYAVLGMEMSVTELRDRLMPSGGGRYGISYYLAPLSTAERPPAWHVAKEPHPQDDGTELIDHVPARSFYVNGDRSLMGEFSIAGGRYVASLLDLKVYGPLSPNAEDGFALAGFARRDQVLARYYSALRKVIASILLATGLAALLIYSIARKQVNRIVDAIRSVHSDAPLFKKVNIAEIDELTSTVSELHKNVSDSAVRMSAAFDMLETPIACYQYDETAPERVFVTPSLNPMLGVEVVDSSMSVEGERWRGVHARLVAHPCADMQNVYEWRPGESDRGVKYFRIEEVRRGDFVIGMVTDVTGQTVSTKELHRRASYDELTHLHNRHSFRKESLALIEREPLKKGVMLFGDLDGLKRINDEYGHSQGDRLIQSAAEAMRAFEAIGGVASRLSGDEFAAYVHGFDTAEDARTAVYSCLSESKTRVLRLSNGEKQAVSMSRGIAIYPDDSDDFSVLLSCADRAMYQAKYSRKGSLVEYSRCSEYDNETLHAMQDEVVRMVNEHRFYYVYQPVFTIGTGVLNGYAVYIRPYSRVLSDPRVALETALMMNLQGRIFNIVFNDNLALLREGTPPKPYRLMVKATKYGQMTKDEFTALSERYSAELKRLDLLIPADTMFNSGQVEEKVRRCRKIGAGVVFERFGANLSDSLELLEFGPDMVRIEIGQIRDAARDDASERRLERIVNQCKTRRVLLLATGIESEVDYVQAKRWGFDMAQGYYLGYPGREFKPDALGEGISAS